MTEQALIERAVDLMLNARHVVALTGAGISTPSGVPDYRSPGSGLWEREADMMEVASIQGFRRRPQAFYEWLRPLLRTIMDARPNAAHLALAQLESAGRLQALITQNIDLLHGRAGSRRLFELHGHLREVVCPACGHVMPAGQTLQEFILTGSLPHCERCRHVMKPNVVLFGELLPWHAIRAARQHAMSADVMLIAGSSLEVSPAGDLPLLAKSHEARLIIINYSETYLDDQADVIIREDVAEVLPRLVELTLAACPAGTPSAQADGPPWPSGKITPHRGVR